MLSLNFIVRALVLVDNKFLVTRVDDGVREPFYTFPGGHVALGETVMEAVIRETEEETGLEVVPTRLLYIVENFFSRSRGKLHELGYYFLCHPLGEVAGKTIEEIVPRPGEGIVPDLIAAAEFNDINFQPRQIGELAAADAAAGFSGNTKLIVINELPGEVGAKDGVFEL